MSYQQGETQERAAARAGISDRTERRIERGECGKQRPPRDWRTRQDPLSDVWDPEILPLLSNQPSLKAVTLLELLESRYPEVDWRRRRRTLERRIRQCAPSNAGQAIDHGIELFAELIESAQGSDGVVFDLSFVITKGFYELNVATGA